MSIKKRNMRDNKEAEKSIESIERDIPKVYKALKSTKITCNGVFDLVEGQEIPKGINEAFHQSLISSKLIK